MMIFGWNSECTGTFQELKKQLLQAPALALTDLAKPCDLYIHEKRGITFRVLAQKLALLTLLVAYFSQQLDQITKGWPPCPQEVAATTVLKEDKKLSSLVSWSLNGFLYQFRLYRVLRKWNGYLLEV